VVSDGLSYHERTVRTEYAFDHPEVGDRFDEMLSFWVYVVGVESDGRVAVMEAHPPCRLPADGKLRIFDSHDAYRAAYAYDSRMGYWVMLADRFNEVGGWFDGFPPLPSGPPDCVRCAALVARDAYRAVPE
jgi:hypothetical protein